MTKIQRSFLTAISIILLMSLVLGAAGCTPTPKTSQQPSQPKGEGTAAAQDQIPAGGQTPAAAVEAKPSVTPAAFSAGQDTPLAPRVVSQTPAGGEEMRLDGAVEVIFDQDMDAEKTAAAWKFTSPDGAAVPGNIQWSSLDTLRFQPDSPLEKNTLYRVELSVEAASQTGVSLEQAYVSFLPTAGDLIVAKVIPADGATDVENGAAITVIFNRPVVPLNAPQPADETPSPIEIVPPVPGQGEWLNTSVYIFRPEQPLHNLTSYKVNVKAGLQDTAGSALQNDYRWQFTTVAPGIAEFGVLDRTANPEDNFINVPLDQGFSLLFRQPMDKASVEAALSIKDKQGQAVRLSAAWENADLVIFKPVDNFAIATNYTLVLDSAAKTAGGAPLQDGLKWHFSTYPLPGIKETNPARNTTQKTYSNWMQIRFLSPMKLDSLKGIVVIKPALEKEDNWTYEPWDNSINLFGLLPSTRYEVHFLPGAEDIYGNATEREEIFRFTTAPVAPYAYLQMPGAISIYRMDTKPQTLYTRSANVKHLDLILYRMSREDFSVALGGDYRNLTLAEADRIASWSISPPAELNKRTSTPTELRDSQGNLLTSGFYFITLTSPELKQQEPYADSRPFIIADANLTLKNNYAAFQEGRPSEIKPQNGETLVWMTDLEKGAPIAGSSLTVYDGYLQPIDSGKTAADGTLMIEAAVPAPPVGTEDTWRSSQRFVMTDTGDPHFAFAASDWGSGVSPYDFGIWSDFYRSPENYQAYVYTDRPIYRPGQPVYYKGILRWDDDLLYSLPKVDQVRVRIDSYDKTVAEELLPLNDYGSFSGEFRLDQDAVLGGYTISVMLPLPEETAEKAQLETTLGGISFNVAEYHKPEFSVDVTTSAPDVLQGDKFKAEIAAQYYSGGDVSDADVRWALSTQIYTFSPPEDYNNYSFTDYEEDNGAMREEGTGFEVIAEGKGKTEPDGRLSMDFEADLTKYKTSQQFTFEATLTDLSGNEVAGRTTLNVHRSRYYPGIQAKTSVATAGEPAAFDLVVLGWDGTPVAGQIVDVDFSERRWSSVQEQNPDGSIEWKSSVENVSVKQVTGIKTGPDGKAILELTPPKGGVYRITVSTQDAEGNKSRAAVYLWVPGEDYIPWRQTNNRSFDLVTDQKHYAPGDTAQVLIASPFEDPSYALVTVERGRIRSREVIQLKSNSTLYPLPITADMIPNVYVSVVIIKGALGSDGKAGAPDFKMGMREIKVNPNEKELTVKVEAAPAEAGPGDEVSFTVKVSDNAGNPVQAEVSLALSDLATLSLVEPNSTPIFDYFYASRQLGITTTVPIVFSMEGFNITVEKQITDGRGGGGGGGGDKGGADTLGVAEVREDFPDTAFWKGQLETAADGTAGVTVTLPDNLTTWRMDARAVSLDTRVGQTTADMQSSKALLVRPQTPRFFVAGDKARVGAAVHNNTDEDLEVLVALDAKGFALSGVNLSTVAIPAGKQAYVSWVGSVDPDVESVDLVFQAKSGAYEDASRPTNGAASFGALRSSGIPVLRYTVMDTVGTAGMLSAADLPADQIATRSEAVGLPQGVAPADLSGNLTVQLAPSLLSALLPGVEALRHYPYECLEQTAARFLANQLSLRLVKASNLKDTNLTEEPNKENNLVLQRIAKGQNSEGGWGWWADETQSDLQTSAFVVYALLTAQANGVTVDADVLGRGLDYLALNLKPVANLDSRSTLDLQAFVLYTLSLSERPAVSDTVQLYNVRQSLSHYGRAYLTLALQRIDAGDPRLQTLLSDFTNSAVLSATGAHWEETQRDPYSWNTNTRTTALVLLAAETIDPQNELNANTMRWLMNSRSQGGYWGTTQETYWTSLAALTWAEATGDLTPDFRYTAALNGGQLGGNEWFTAKPPQQMTEFKALEPQVLTVGVDQMKTDQINRLTLARSGGAGTLYYSAHLNVSLPVEKVEAASRGVVVSRAYYAADNTRQAVVKAAYGETLLARLTIVAPNDLHYLVIDDPLPAGLEAVDQSLLTSARATNPDVPPSGRQDDLLYKGWGWEYFQHVEIRDEKVVLSASFLPAGTYTYTYLVRAGTSGSFRVIPPSAQEFYFPEVYGRGAGSLFEVANREE